MVRLELQIPRFFRPRTYQAEFYSAMRAGCRRAALVWHRRAGKDATTFNWMIEAMLRRPGSYYYFFPTYKQGKRILWDGIQGDGKPFLSHFPEELIEGEPNNTELKIKLRLPNGEHSIFQILGADKVDNSSIGTNPVGVVFSEYSLMNPGAWDLVRPILAENLGWAVFVFTPRGKNWGHKLWLAAREASHEWFTSLKTINDTCRDGANEGDRFGQAVVPLDVVNAERRDGMAEELVHQEFYCSFEGALMGAYFSRELDRMRAENRIAEVRWNRDVDVDTSWDLGVDDETVIGFWQSIEDVRTGREYLHLIDVHAGNRGGVEEYWRFMKNEKPYTYGRHYGPHDLRVQEWGTGNTRVQTAARFGLHFEVVKKLSIADGHNAIRRMLPHLWVDAERCEKWIEMLGSYRREFDEERMTFLDKPVHDQASHWADMSRYRAIAYANRAPLIGRRERQLPDRADTNYNVFERGGSAADAFSRATNWSVFGR